MNGTGARNPLEPIWVHGFPFCYWDNRIKKINPYNPHDRLEALFVYLQLADLYTHSFVAKVRNPDQPWFTVKENTRAWDLGNTLKKLENEVDGRETVFTEILAEEPEGLISIEMVLDWGVTKKDWIAADLLGCPVSFDKEAEEVNFLEEPNLHFAGANLHLNSWRENRELLNDFKHGFRIIPFNIDLLDLMSEYGFLEESKDIKALRNQLVEHEQSDNWDLYFLRMSAQEVDEELNYDYEVTLNLHKAKIGACVEASELVLSQLNNLFGKGGSRGIERQLVELMSRADKDSPDTVQVIEHVADFAVIYTPQ